MRQLGLAGDPVESVSGKASAIVAYYPVTDFVNFGATGKTVFDDNPFPFVGLTRMCPPSRTRADSGTIAPS